MSTYTYTIVVARYQENIEWIDKMKKENIVIYNKGPDIIEDAIPRPNIGREAETFFYHIVNHYHDLPDYLILLQGNPFEHMEGITPDNLQEEIDTLLEQGVSDVQALFADLFIEEHETNIGLRTIEYCHFFFDINNIPGVCNFAAGCQYIIPRENIICRPIEFYMRLYTMICYNKILTSEESHCDGYFVPDAIDGWTLERILLYFFTKEIPLSETMKKKYDYMYG